MRAEAALRESEERFRAAVGQAAVGVVLVGRPDNRTLFANRGLCQMLGYAARHELLAGTFHRRDPRRTTCDLDYAHMPRG